MTLSCFSVALRPLDFLIGLTLVLVLSHVYGQPVAHAEASDDAEGAILYRETFSNPTGKPQPLARFGWHYHLGPEGWDEKGNAATQSLVNENPGAQPALHSVNAGPEADRDPRGFVVNGLGPNGTDPKDYWNQLSHYCTTEFALDLAKTPLKAIAFDLALSQPDRVHVTVKVDGNWYASKQAFTATPLPDYGIYNRFAKDAVTRSLDPRGPVWLPLSFKPNTTLGLDTSARPVQLPRGELQGFGLLLKPTGFEAFDNYTLIGEPVPADQP